MNYLLKILKESGINFFGSIIGMVLNYILLMMLTRFLTPEEFGSFVLAQAIINVSIAFVLVGMHKSLDRFIPFYHSLGEIGKIKTLIFNIIKWTLGLSLIAVILFFISADFISLSIFKKKILARIFKIMIISIPLLTFIQIVVFSFIGFKELRYQVYIQKILLPLIQIIFGAVIFIRGFKLIGWVCMYIASLFVASFFAFFLLRKKIIKILFNISPIEINFKEIISYSWPLSINSVILFVSSQIALLFLGYFGDSAEVGVFRIYVYLTFFISLVMSSFAQIYKPVISDLIARKKIREIHNIYKRVSKWIFLINALFFMIVLLFGIEIVKILFTDKYLITPIALFILAGGKFINSWFGPEGVTLEAFGNTKLSMLNSLIILWINLVLSYMLIPRYGLIGASIVASISPIIGGLCGFIEIFWLYRLNPFTSEYFKYILGIFSISWSMHIFISFCNKFFPPLFLIILGIFILGFLYISYLYKFKIFDDQDYEFIKHIRYKIGF